MNRFEGRGRAVAFVTIVAFCLAVATPRVAQALPQCCSVCYQNHQAECTRTRRVWIPRYVSNAAKGDLILHQGSELILLILANLGQFFSHIAIFTDNGYTFRHNTFSFDKNHLQDVLVNHVNILWDVIFGVVDYGDVYLNRQWLANGPPGTQTLSIDTSGYFSSSNPTTSILKAKSGRASHTAAIANKFATFTDTYRLGAFKDYRREAARASGGMCSGSLLKATELSASSGVRPFLLKTYPQSQVQASLYSLWLFLKDEALRQCQNMSDCSRLPLSSQTTIAYGIAHQVAHCFNQGPTANGSALECKRMDAVAWASYPTGNAVSVSPDDIVNQEQECFAAGTPVTMADGTTRAIETIGVGDLVLAYDVDADRMVPSRVVRTFEHPDVDTSVLVNGTLRTTANHPFWVGGRWLEARYLQPGDALLTLSSPSGGGMTMVATSVVSVETLAGRQTVYNLEVDGQHDYFAGGVLVHNKTNRATDYTGATVHTTATNRGNAVVNATFAGGFWQTQTYVDQACLDAQCSGCSWQACGVDP
jgi:hypothetical protein